MNEFLIPCWPACFISQTTQQTLMKLFMRGGGSTLKVVIHISFWAISVIYNPCFTWNRNQTVIFLFRSHYTKNWYMTVGLFKIYYFYLKHFLTWCKFNGVQGVSIMTRLWAIWLGFYSWQGQGSEFFPLPQHPDQLWGLSSHLSSRYQGLCPWEQSGQEWSWPFTSI
jgi:hypothetical protein